MRFHSKPLEQLAKENDFYANFQSIAVGRQGIFRCGLLELAEKLGVKPYHVPKVLYSMQHNSCDDMAYDLDQESFILEFFKIPA